MAKRQVISGLLISVMLSGAAVAQELVRFDEAAGYAVLGATPQGILVENAGTAFICGVEELSGSILSLDHCQAVLGPQAAAVAAQAESRWFEEQSGVAELLFQLPEAAFAGAIRNVMMANGCTLDGSNEDALRAWFIPAVAAQLGLQPPYSDEVIDAIDEGIGDGADELIDAGDIVVNEANSTARLVNCP